MFMAQHSQNKTKSLAFPHGLSVRKVWAGKHIPVFEHPLYFPDLPPWKDLILNRSKDIQSTVDTNTCNKTFVITRTTVLQKKVLECIEWPTIRSEMGVRYTDPRKRRFHKAVQARSVTRYPRL
jgi:hypothetical protein